MRVCFQKLPKNTCYISAIRSDGVSLCVSRGRQFSLPHDLAHFIIESELNMKNGFWGCIAKGALVKGAIVTGGKQKPHARSRSSKLIDRHRGELLEAEDAVRILTLAARERKSTSNNSSAIEQLKQDYPNDRYEELTSADGDRIISLIREFSDRWQSLPEYSYIELHWNELTPLESMVRSKIAAIASD